MSSRDAAEQTVRDIRRKTRKQYSAEEKIRMLRLPAPRSCCVSCGLRRMLTINVGSRYGLIHSIVCGTGRIADGKVQPSAKGSIETDRFFGNCKGKDDANQQRLYRFYKRHANT